ncbi:acyl-CoA synthetase [Polymorphum gilvum]|uniref:AMP-dependent synthetase and ligase n=1 Tax=Polymorphum gilvum (strain LMG 25793 / CGMCC 1.9160 / SL003B-26A1) TaxID=991905 RepID=F2J259_POLGS|nr:acyl-CoA synthetase [Polymorphum gilvum]ADZ68818.1 AMP-dependent synthetase and ligase [Polymorphum gilvum SL003B-26A1]
MLPDASNYADLRARFRWDVPETFNIAVAVCDRWAEAEPAREALVFAEENGPVRSYSYGELRALSNRLANLYVARGLKRGDRVGVLLPQSPETAVAHIAALKAGAISIPLFTLFGAEALEYRLGDSGTGIVVTDRTGAARIATIRDRLPALETVLCTDGPAEGAEDLHALMADQPDLFRPVATRADDPALIIYTSGTTGQPKGALHAHRVLLGHLPGVEMSHDFLPQPGDRFWTPADWAWIGGLLDVLMPALYHGIPVVACRFRKFTGEAAFQLLQDHKIRNAFLPPTALKMMRQVQAPETRWTFSLRSVASGGETLGSELIDWGRKTFGLTINEFYGQTECNMIVSSCAAVMPARPGIMGRPVPGHAVDVVDASGAVVPDETLGIIAVKRPDPVMFLGYWNNPAATAAKFAGDWLLTGDTGMRDADGWIRFVGRDDDVITSSGYRIGPGEIEDCLLKHPAVALAGVIGKPDPQRTEIVKAYVVLKDGVAASDALATEIAQFVRDRLAAHEYPREIAFVDALPMTTTGKVIRRELRRRAIEELQES